MRAAWVMAAALGAVLAGCGNRAEKVAQADANASAAGFVPPAVTSRVDFAGAMERRFRTLDRNADDQLTADELPRRGSRIMTLDRNGDGAVSQIEWSEGTLKRFDQMDLNHDGTVTSEEEAAWRAARDKREAGSGSPADSVIGDTVSNIAGNAGPTRR
ncbi:hypothetical protein D9601_10170 [Sphingomonas sp. MA1305]|uniref:hypothetical protein n=1 Tax=Sphingomonas sp. MA1305 TaxID=2479204 RepID=UPI0018DF2309|nr:hypothetical protein [Sphingomonas sp. MA1305]MBI0475717.1 hypothetical protein [Sphingomonas sp. MA1305]